ncbi:MAG TPA: hypothetical protein PK566_19090 [Pseudobacteroides sp.]|nr:hypothetical protein [Pseudobacteroides sp.]
METINDIVFGEMSYNHGWVNRKKFKFWGKIIEFKIKVVTYEENMILDSQRKDYQYFEANLEDISNGTYDAVKQYIEDYWDEYIKPDLPHRVNKDVNELVKPKTIIFDEGNVFGILCDCLWDEHGIAIQVLPEIEIGPQDVLL